MGQYVRLEKLSLNLTILVNFWSVPNLPFLGKMMPLQSQRVQDEMDYLDLFQSSFRLDFGKKIALENDLYQGVDMALLSFCFVGLLVAFDTINHNVLLGYQ